MPENERTPLVATVRVEQRQPRYRTFPHSTFRRFCSIALGSCIIFVIVAAVFILAFLPDECRDSSFRRHHGHNCNPSHDNKYTSLGATTTKGLTLAELQEILLETPSEEKAREHSQYYTSGPHLAGKNLSQALWTRDRWQEAGVKSDLVAYDVYINYPIGHRLALLEVGKHGQAVKYECSLTEDVLEEDPTTNLTDRIPTFHGYSANGNVTAQYVYVNYGTYWDFADLVARNISLEGKIAIAKYGRNFRGLKVKRAQELGMVGVVMYSDPQDDGEMTEQNGYKPYPDGPARNPSSVQRGSTQFLSSLPGDPTTPGYPSKPGVPRTHGNLSIPQIPSLPISYADALPLLQALNGHGPNASSFSKYWQGGGLAHRNVTYSIGPSPSHIQLNLVNEQEYTTTPLWNVIGVINGTLKDEVIVLGNHRDAWIAGGAGDPNSGSAALNEVIRSFGIALSRGWKPLRTIVFASWDGEEYGLVGSTEWVEEYIGWLGASTVAYLNVDVGARGSQFTAAASPLLNDLLYNVTATVPSPAGNGTSVFDKWSGHQIRTMGSGSDFTAFQDFAGIASLDIGFSNGPKDPVYHYHSNYDSFHFMDKYGDPKWGYHTTITKVWALLAAKLADSPVLPLSAGTYAKGLQHYITTVKEGAKTSNISKADFSFSALESAVDNLHITARQFDVHSASLTAELGVGVPWWKFWQRVQLWYKIKKVNSLYKLLERQFLYAKGLDGDRSWFKHVVFAPGRWTGYAGATFPGLVESFEDGDLNNVFLWEGIILDCLRRADDLLALS